MPKMSVTLTRDDIKLAVSEWAEKHHGFKIEPKDVHVSAKQEWQGHGMMESQVAVADISFETK